MSLSPSLRPAVPAGCTRGTRRAALEAATEAGALGGVDAGPRAPRRLAPPRSPRVSRSARGKARARSRFPERDPRYRFSAGVEVLVDTRPRPRTPRPGPGTTPVRQEQMFARDRRISSVRLSFTLKHRSANDLERPARLVVGGVKRASTMLDRHVQTVASGQNSPARARLIDSSCISLDEPSRDQFLRIATLEYLSLSHQGPAENLCRDRSSGSQHPQHPPDKEVITLPAGAPEQRAP